MKIAKRLLGATFVVALGACNTTANKTYDYTKWNPEIRTNVMDFQSKLNLMVNRGEHLLVPDIWEDLLETHNSIKSRAGEGVELMDMGELVTNRNFLYNESVKAIGERKSTFSPLLDVRQSALKNGALGLESFKEADDRVRELAEDFTDHKSSYPNSEFSKIEKMYQSAEVQGIVKAQLRMARGDFDSAVKMDGEDYFPKKYKAVEQAISEARTKIKQRPKDPKYFRQSVSLASAKAAEFFALTQTAVNFEEQGPAKSSENLHYNLNTVLKNLYYNQPEVYGMESKFEIVELESEYVPYLVDELSDAQIRASVQNHKLKQAKDSNQKLKKDLKAYNQKMKTLEEVKKMFTKSEVEFYIKNNDLVARLVGLSFEFNKSKLPKKSKALLEKLAVAAEKMEAEEIQVVGHSDSTGDAMYNRKLSRERASRVSQFLSKNLDLNSSSIDTKGLGFQRPYAENKTKKGRELNRSVEIIFEEILI